MTTPVRDLEVVLDELGGKLIAWHEAYVGLKRLSDSRAAEIRQMRVLLREALGYTLDEDFRQRIEDTLRGPR